ncbi:MAG TPA: hypothetical protein VLW83_12180 [Candidatus Acidoferrales bacterium]|nr:hypothetical protein [Candidatus Acidoferrales bacterium]
MSAGYGEFEFEPELKVQFESKIEGLLSGTTDYNHFEITNIGPHGQGFEATAQIYFPGKVESLYLRTDASAEKITDLSASFRLPGTSPDDDPPEEEPVDPKRREANPGEGTGRKQEPADGDY